MTVKRWRALIRVLRKHSPIEGRVVVRRRPMKKLNGQMTFDGADYEIVVNSQLDSQTQAETLIHEWAHMLTIEGGYSHGEAWGATYSRIYSFCDEHSLPSTKKPNPKVK